MLLRLWTQSLEKLYRFFKHIISGLGFKKITNHLKVLVQCGGIVKSLGAHLLAGALIENFCKMYNILMVASDM